MELYKITGPNGAPFHGGSGAWPLPSADGPGEWREVEGRIDPCHNGLHLCRRRDILEWLGPEIYAAEHEGEIVECDDKVVTGAGRH